MIPPPLLSRMREIRTQLGMFRQIQTCEIAGYSEPPLLTAECLSRFDRGEAKESFVFHNYQKDNSLLSYSATFLRATVSELRSPIK
jgi:hypothetical protein